MAKKTEVSDEQQALLDKIKAAEAAAAQKDNPEPHKDNPEPQTEPNAPEPAISTNTHSDTQVAQGLPNGLDGNTINEEKAGKNPFDPSNDPAYARAKDAHEKIANLIERYPDDTPAEHIMFGYGGVRITFGDMKAAFGLS